MLQRLGTAFTAGPNSSRRDKMLGNLMIEQGNSSDITHTDGSAYIRHIMFCRGQAPFPLEVLVQLAVSAKFGAIFNAKIPGKFCVRTFTPWEFPNTTFLAVGHVELQ